jgi:glutamine cyclotransferase
VARYPHASNNFTQGLEIAAGALFESSGLYGQSFIARQAWPPADSLSPSSTNPPTARQPLPARYFGEGLTVVGDKIYLLTWREQQGFIFDRHSLNKIGEFALQGEGWGLTHNGQQLVVSDGSAVLRFLDAQTFALQKSLTVTLDGAPLAALNELEWIAARAGRPARLLANIWQTDTIVVIDPASGRVTATLDCSALYPAGQRAPHADVLNGIAVDADDTLLVTGKFWPHIYRLKLQQALP